MYNNPQSHATQDPQDVEVTRIDDSIPLFEQEQAQNQESNQASSSKQFPTNSPFANSNNSTHDNSVPIGTAEENKTIEGLSFWLRFAAVLLYISAVSSIIIGTITLFAIIGLFVIVAGVFQIILGKKLWQASIHLQKLNQNSDTFSFRGNTFKTLEGIKYYFKWTGIWTVISLALIPIFGVLMILLAIYGFGGLKNISNFDSQCNYTRSEDRIQYCSTSESSPQYSTPRLNLDFPND